MKYIPLLLITLLLCSCDCFMRVGGTVVDKQTRQPIGHATLSRFTNNKDGIVYSDSSGKFEYTAITGGIRPSLTLYFSKEGYKPQTVKYRRMMVDTVFLERN